MLIYYLIITSAMGMVSIPQPDYPACADQANMINVNRTLEKAFCVKGLYQKSSFSRT